MRHLWGDQDQSRTAAEKVGLQQTLHTALLPGAWKQHRTAELVSNRKGKMEAVQRAREDGEIP